MSRGDIREHVLNSPGTAVLTSSRAMISLSANSPLARSPRIPPIACSANRSSASSIPIKYLTRVILVRKPRSEDCRVTLTFGSIITYCTSHNAKDDACPGWNKSRGRGGSDETGDGTGTKTDHSKFALQTEIKQAPSYTSLRARQIHGQQ
jgi:hypothetical protein